MTEPATTEDNWTRPSTWCPHPELWHADDTDATEHEVSWLAGAFVRALQPEVVIETGTYEARTAYSMATALDVNGHGHLWTIEVNPELAALAEKILAGLPATAICGDSRDWDPPSPIGFAWIDSGPLSTRPSIGWDGQDHGHMRHDEITRWLPLFEAGAVIGIHDTAPHHPVMAAIEPLLATGRLLPGLTLRTPRGVTFAQAPGKRRYHGSAFFPFDLP